MSLPFVLVGFGEGPRGLSYVPSLRARRVSCQMFRIEQAELGQKPPGPNSSRQMFPLPSRVGTKPPLRPNSSRQRPNKTEMIKFHSVPAFRSGVPFRCSVPAFRSGAPFRRSVPALRSGAPFRSGVIPLHSGVPFRSGAPLCSGLCVPFRSGVPFRSVPSFWVILGPPPLEIEIQPFGWWE